MTDDFDDVLAAAVRATGVARYRWLCSEANTLPPPNSREDWRRYIRGRTWERPSGPPPPPIDPEYAARLPPLGGCCGGAG